MPLICRHAAAAADFRAPMPPHAAAYLLIFVFATLFRQTYAIRFTAALYAGYFLFTSCRAIEARRQRMLLILRHDSDTLPAGVMV